LRRPSPTLVVDAAILIAATRGRSSGALRQANRDVRLITTDRAVEEARRRIVLGMQRPELIEILDALAALMTVIPARSLAPLIIEAERMLRQASASGNGSVREAHLAALAVETDSDLWTTDRDFAGTGVATWSTPNLMVALTAGAD
jgi:predicted nucleic acid-binding protein